MARAAAPSGAREVPRYVPGPGRLAGVPVDRTPPFLAGQVFRLEESIRDDRYVIRAELPGLDPENDIEVTVDGRILTIRAERRQQDNGPYRSEFRYGSLDPRGQASPPGSTPRTSPPGTTRASSRSASPPGPSSQKAPGSPSRMPTRCPNSPLTRLRCPAA